MQKHWYMKDSAPWTFYKMSMIGKVLRIGVKWWLYALILLMIYLILRIIISISRVVHWTGLRIPKIAPEEIIKISTDNKFAEMEAKFMFYDNALSEIRRENATIENRMNGIEKSIGPDKSAYPSKTPTPSANSVSASTPSTPTPSTSTSSTPTPSTPTPSAPTPSEYSASTPTPSASTSCALISSEPSSSAPIPSAHTPRAFLTRVSPSKPDVHADVTLAAPESCVTVVRRSYPKRLNLTSNKSARVSNASRESGSRVSK